MFEPSKVAKAYLRLKRYVLPNQKKLLAYFNNEFRFYNGMYWDLVSEKEIHNEIVNFIEEDEIIVGEKFSIPNVGHSVKALEALVTIKNVELNSFTGEKTPSNVHYIPVQNGILEISGVLGELKVSLKPHSPDFISTYVLPYEYNPGADCPLWKKFLIETLPPDRIFLLQEWFGYQLIPVTLGQKFMIYVGVGANGKSVVCLVQGLMLGEENVSSVPLQAFLAGERFGLTSTKNKLANIVPEIDEMRTFPTAKIKAYSVGEPFIVEQKFKDPYRVKPTARLTFATNALPPFRDKSDGLKRRLLIIPFENQILDESKQDKRLVDENHWINEGELSGILNWAIEGLKRLMVNNWQFTVTPSLKAFIENYNRELNPTLQFLEDYVETHPYSKVFSPHLYSKYVEFCRDSGFTPDNAVSFGKAVSDRFKGYITFDKHARPVNGKRGRYVRGIRLIEHSLHRDALIEDEALLEHQNLIENKSSSTLLTHVTQIGDCNLIAKPLEAKSSIDPKGETYESNDKK